MSNKNMEFKDSGIPWIGQIPKHWEVIRNKYVFTHKKEIVGSKFKNFDICEKECVGIENMFGIYPKFGKVLFMEHLEAILIFVNKSDKELRLKDLKIGFTNQSQNQKDVLSKIVEK